MIIDPYADPEDEQDESQEAPQVSSRDAFKEARKKLTKAAFYEQLANGTIFKGDSEEDEEVNQEIQEWAEGQMFKLLNVSQPTNQLGGQFTTEEVAVLKVLSQLSPEEINALKALSETVMVTASGLPVSKMASLPSPTAPAPKLSSPEPRQKPIKARPPEVQPAPKANRVKPLRNRQREIPKAGEYKRVNQGAKFDKSELAPPPTALPYPVGAAYEAAQAALAQSLVSGMASAQVDTGQGQVATLGADQISGLVQGYLK